jgi:hypothetical protein
MSSDRLLDIAAKATDAGLDQEDMAESADEIQDKIEELGIGDAGEYAVSFISRFSKPIGVIYFVFVILLLLSFIFSSSLFEIFSIVC